jgi:hypothetical protein
MLALCIGKPMTAGSMTRTLEHHDRRRSHAADSTQCAGEACLQTGLRASPANVSGNGTRTP